MPLCGWRHTYYGPRQLPRHSSGSIYHLGIQYGHVFTGAKASFAWEAVLNDHVGPINCITASDRGYNSSTIESFTIVVTLKVKEDKDNYRRKKALAEINENKIY